MDKSNDKERIYIDLAIDPECQGDLKRSNDILYNFKVMDYPDHADQIGSIQRKIREIFAIVSLMTSCLRDRK